MQIENQIVDSILTAKNIVITSHKSPDGDSIGSSVAMFEFCKALGKTAIICHPDPAAEYISWILPENGYLNLEENKSLLEQKIQEADLIFALDYNDESRVGKDMEELLRTASAKKIMIDHHLNPSDFATISYSFPEVSSTCQLIYEVIEKSGNEKLIFQKTGQAIYLGMMTDTGSFRFPAVTSRTHEIIGKLIDLGVKHYEIHENVFDTNTLDRLRLRGYACSEKLEILEGIPVAFISLTAEELNRFKYEKGDTEGLVNVALSIQGIKIAAFFSEAEKENYTKISFRSKGENNAVNTLSGDYFNGGGHKNAAGGRFDGNISDAIALFKSVVVNYIEK
jgi:bifunctional oligoribonuclease and PAP phosphatase NrnA